MFLCVFVPNLSLVEVTNNFPVQDLVVLLRENAKKSKQHYGQEAKLGVIHHGTGLQLSALSKPSTGFLV